MYRIEKASTLQNSSTSIIFDPKQLSSNYRSYLIVNYSALNSVYEVRVYLIRYKGKFNWYLHCCADSLLHVLGLKLLPYAFMATVPNCCLFSLLITFLCCVSRNKPVM